MTTNKHSPRYNKNKVNFMWLYRYHRTDTHTRKRQRHNFFFSFYSRQAFQSFCSIQIKRQKKTQQHAKIYVLTVDKNLIRTMQQCSSFWKVPFSTALGTTRCNIFVLLYQNSFFWIITFLYNTAKRSTSGLHSKFTI